MSQDAASVLIEGPWEHRLVAANGARFHIAESGDGPLVLLLHGFPQFWYAWRHQIPLLVAAGYRVAAMDLRGYGASDKPPRGYDTYTSTADVAAVVRALGEQEAIVLGQGLGGWIAWSMPSLQPGVTRAIGSLSMPHPRIMRHASLTPGPQLRANRYVMGLQRPFVPERRMAERSEDVERLLRAWAAPDGQFPTTADVERYTASMALPFVAHSAAEYYRWIGRSQLRQDGPLFAHRVRVPVPVPVLHIQGVLDGCVLAEATTGSAAYVTGPYELHLIEGAGHFLTEEAPQTVGAMITTWLHRLPTG